MSSCAQWNSSNTPVTVGNCAHQMCLGAEALPITTCSKTVQNAKGVHNHWDVHRLYIYYIYIYINDPCYWSGTAIFIWFVTGFMMTSSNKNIFRVTVLCVGKSQVNGEFPAQSPVSQSFDVYFDMRLNKRLSKQSQGWWFETPSCSLWRHCTPLK